MRSPSDGLVAIRLREVEDDPAQPRRRSRRSRGACRYRRRRPRRFRPRASRARRVGRRGPAWPPSMALSKSSAPLASWRTRTRCPSRTARANGTSACASSSHCRVEDLTEEVRELGPAVGCQCGAVPRLRCCGKPRARPPRRLRHSPTPAGCGGGCRSRRRFSESSATERGPPARASATPGPRRYRAPWCPTHRGSGSRAVPRVAVAHLRAASTAAATSSASASVSVRQSSSVLPSRTTAITGGSPSRSFTASSSSTAQAKLGSSSAVTIHRRRAQRSLRRRR